VAAIPHSEKLNRGKATLQDLRSAILRRGAYGLVMVLEKNANPSALVFYEPGDITIVRKLMLRIKSVRLGRETKDFQKPLGMRELVINLTNVSEGLVSDVANALVTMFKPRIYSGEPPLRSIEIVLTGGNEVEVSFICTSSNRPCGPTFKVFKVIKFE